MLERRQQKSRLGGGSARTGFAAGSMHFRIVQYRKYTDRAKLSTGFPCGEEKSESNA